MQGSKPAQPCPACQHALSSASHYYLIQQMERVAQQYGIRIRKQDIVAQPRHLRNCLRLAPALQARSAQIGLSGAAGIKACVGSKTT